MCTSKYRRSTEVDSSAFLLSISLDGQRWGNWWETAGRVGLLVCWLIEWLLLLEKGDISTIKYSEQALSELGGPSE